jgi:MFS transporter, FHS family, L-fucose permease
LMGVYAVVNIVLLGIAIAFPGWTGLGALLLTSFFMSLMYPTIYALGLKDLGTNVTLGASIIVMAIVGGAVFTPLIGWVAELTKSMATALWIPVAGYVVVTYFAFIGSSIREPGLTID